MKNVFTLVAIGSMCISCTWSNSRIKPFAPIKKTSSYQDAIETPQGKSRKDVIYKAILEQCPLGSTREEVLEYIHKNFWTLAIGMKPNTDIYFRIEEGGTFPVGSSWGLVGFKFDDQDRLQELYVDYDGVYL